MPQERRGTIHRHQGAQKKIEGFKELNFDVHGPRHGRMDMGQFLEYLKCHDLTYMFVHMSFLRCILIS